MIEKRGGQFSVVEKRVRDASTSADVINSLRGLVRELADEGYAKQEIYELFESVMLTVRQQNNEADSPQEDALLEVMDMLSGFCKPDLVLLPDET
jgi:hypothetical protein